MRLPPTLNPAFAKVHLVTPGNIRKLEDVFRGYRERQWSEMG